MNSDAFGMSWMFFSQLCLSISLGFSSPALPLFRSSYIADYAVVHNNHIPTPCDGEGNYVTSNALPSLNSLSLPGAINEVGKKYNIKDVYYQDSFCEGTQ